MCSWSCSCHDRVRATASAREFVREIVRECDRIHTRVLENFRKYVRECVRGRDHARKTKVMPKLCKFEAKTIPKIKPNNTKAKSKVKQKINAQQ